MFFCFKEISMFNIVVLLFTGEQFLSPEDLLETGAGGRTGVGSQGQGGREVGYWGTTMLNILCKQTSYVWKRLPFQNLQSNSRRHIWYTGDKQRCQRSFLESIATTWGLNRSLLFSCLILELTIAVDVQWVLLYILYSWAFFPSKQE